MKRADPKSAEALSARLGHAFSDPDLLRKALTHSSVRGGAALSNYERLEFLGDRVLGLAIAEFLTERFPRATQGELARRYNRLVRGETCAEVAQDIELGQHVIMSASEQDSGGRAKTTILGDACEAVLGAVFLDGGYEAARTVIYNLWSPYLDASDAAPRDPKSALQEWAQGKGRELPRYVELERTGPDHAPVFTTRVEVEGMDPAEGKGPSKRMAEQAAAAAMLVREGVWSEPVDERE